MKSVTYLRKFVVNDELSINTDCIDETSKTKVYSINHSLYDCSSLLLVTSDVCISKINENSIHIIIENERDKNAIQQFDDSVIKALVSSSSILFHGDRYTEDEIREDVFHSSITTSNSVLSLVYDTKDMSPLRVYDPNRMIISTDRLVPKVIIKCALRPWKISIQKKHGRARILWIVDHVMIVDEPIHEDCLINAEDSDDDNDNDSI